MFFGPRITTVFASRWKALAWSGGVLLTAYCSIPADDDNGANSAASAPSGTAAHVSPWAITWPTPTPTPGH